MITLRQLRALHWIAQLGTFERAADRLNTTQSAISKRVQELELSVGRPIFDRSQRGARLTEEGEHILALGKQMLELEERIAALGLGHAGTVPAYRLRLGFTELSTYTWLPKLIGALKEQYPSLTIEADVNASRELFARLQDDDLDLVFISEAFTDPDVTSVRLAELSSAWMARPGFVKEQPPLTLQELGAYPILLQGRRSGSGIGIHRWIKSQGIVFSQMLLSDNMMTMLGLTIAGLGIGNFPRECFKRQLDEGKLVEIQTIPPLPNVPYAAMYKHNRPSALIENVVKIAQRVCDFTTQFGI
jgi:DNA-binding transcriptional LysR family regulator